MNCRSESGRRYGPARSALRMLKRLKTAVAIADQLLNAFFGRRMV